MEVTDDRYGELMSRLLSSFPGLSEQQRTESYEVHTSQDGGLRSSVRARQHELFVDEPEEWGADTAANPAEVALAALGASLEVTARLYAALLGIPVAGLSTVLRSELQLGAFLGLSEEGAGFSRVSAEIAVAGDVDAQRLQQLQEVVEQHCPILDVFRSPVLVDLRLVPSSPEAANAASSERS